MIRAGQRLAWGLAVDMLSVAAWGARAIWDGHTTEAPVLLKSGRRSRTRVERVAFIDLLWDRQASEGDEQDRRRLGEWIDTKGMPALRKLVVTEKLHTDERRQLVVADGNYRLIANPNGSYGYLYLCAMLVQNAKLLRERYGERLIGKQVRTVPMGRWPGGVATVVDLGHDPAAPEIVMNVHSDKHGDIGVFEYEPIELVEEAPTLRREVIQQALAYVHANEKQHGRVEAAKGAIQVLSLSEAEAEVLRGALNIN